MSAKDKLRKFAEVEGFNNVVQPAFDEVFKKDYRLKGNWSKQFFKNDKKITLELGCGKGEYTVGQARLFPDRNFIGLDIKGARIWRGAKTAVEENISNVGFIRTRIDFINSFFEKGEIDEIWITFPDPQPKKALKRLTSSRFLGFYQKVLSDKATVNLKTDSVDLFTYTIEMAKYNNLLIEECIHDIYKSEKADDPVLSIKTYYEKTWLKEGLKSQYIRFVPGVKELKEPPEDER